MKILYLHGLGRHGHDQLYQDLRKYIPEEVEILTLDISPRAPRQSYEKIKALVDRESPEVVIGFSMGGFFADLLSIPFKLYINPALHLPEYISKKSGPTVEEFKDLAKEYRFKHSPRRCIDIVGTLDERIGKASLPMFSENYKEGTVKTFEGGHDIGESEVKTVVIPELLNLIK